MGNGYNRTSIGPIECKGTIWRGSLTSSGILVMLVVCGGECVRAWVFTSRGGLGVCKGIGVGSRGVCVCGCGCVGCGVFVCNLRCALLM